MDPSQGGSNPVLRDYRKGNWTVEETMVLIEAKRMDDQRRMKRLGDGGERGKPPELRWRWVEDYCWKNGCLRSQNQCNDKWDNLMRDFKKVMEYERRVAESGAGGGAEVQKSYWMMEKNERKDRNLPSNMLLQVYEALVDVVERRGQTAAAGGAGSSGTASVPIPPPHQLQPQYPAMLLPPPLPPSVEPSPSVPSSQPFPTVGTLIISSLEILFRHDSSKRRKRRGGEGTSSGGGEEVGSAISRSASIIAEAMQSCEEREERRHRELLSLHQRRLQIEESKAEINRQGINGVVDAINRLANSILAFADNRNQSPPAE